MNNRPFRLRRQRGAVLVEFAVVLPVAFLLFMAFLEISHALLLQHSVDTAAYEGARHAMVPGAKASEAVIAASKLCKSARLKDYQVIVDPEVITEETPFITVRVEIPVSSNALGGSFFFKSKRLSSQVTLMCERPPMVQLTGIPVLGTKIKKLKSSGLGVGLTTAPALQKNP